MLKDLGVDYVIIGHSERRAYFAETDETVNKKVHAAFKHGLTADHLRRREAGRARSRPDEGSVPRADGSGAARSDAPSKRRKSVIAYEPIWAIGTGKSSTAEDANEVIGYIRERGRSGCSATKRRTRSASNTAAA